MNEDDLFGRPDYFCFGCGVQMGWMDQDPNGDMGAICARCDAEDRHDFDAEPQVTFDRHGRRILPI